MPLLPNEMWRGFCHPDCLHGVSSNSMVSYSLRTVRGSRMSERRLVWRGGVGMTGVIGLAIDGEELQYVEGL